MDLSQLWNRWIIDCCRCNTEGVARRPWEDLAHDIRCWGWSVAFNNLFFRLEAAFCGW